ncbi:hypothetical protein ACEPAH_5596 [Sanghuangporus vaninii]
MALFRGHMLRSIFIAGVLFLTARYINKRMPDSLYTFTVTQTSIAIIAISTLMLLVIQHHRRQGRVLTQTQEEMLLLGGFALFSLAAFVAHRAYGQRDVQHSVHDGPAPLHEMSEAPSARTTLSPFGHGYGGLEPHRVPRSPVPRPPQRVGVQSEGPGGLRSTPWTCPEDAVRCVVEEWYY